MPDTVYDDTMPAGDFVDTSDNPETFVASLHHRGTLLFDVTEDDLREWKVFESILTDADAWERLKPFLAECHRTQVLEWQKKWFVKAVREKLATDWAEERL